jgi:hypothetical protein
LATFISAPQICGDGFDPSRLRENHLMIEMRSVGFPGATSALIARNPL